MKPDKFSIHDLFAKERRYTVPLYQRAYVWNTEEQWQPLWEDIERLTEAYIANPDGPYRTHFLGAIVLNGHKITGNALQRLDVIDGQQRLTTLQLFLAALRDHARAAGSDDADKLERLTGNLDAKSGTDAIFKVWPTNADRPTFRAVMLAGSPEILCKQLGQMTAKNAPRLAAAYLFFSEEIAAFTAKHGATADLRNDRIGAIVAALRVSLHLVGIELEHEDDPQIIFETLNARGQPLLPSDLIRNMLFQQAASEAGKSNPDLADELYARYWYGFDNDRLDKAVNGENRWWHLEERQGRLTRPRIDLFIFHYLAMKTRQELVIGQLFREFRSWRDGDKTALEPFLEELKIYATHFRRLVEPTGQERIAIFARRMRTLDTSTVYPLLLRLSAISADSFSAESLDQVVADIESWLIRRLFCNLTNKNYNKFFLALLGKIESVLDSAAEEPTAAQTDDGHVQRLGPAIVQAVRAELLRSSDPTLRWPDDSEFRAAWLERPFYKKAQSARSEMILRALNTHMQTAKSETLSGERLTVEHILPQAAQLADYPYPVDIKIEAGETRETYRQRLIHTMGNLTLLTGALNTSAGNNAFGDKRLKILKDSDLRINAWFRETPLTAWSESNILERGEDMFSRAQDVWRHPGQG
ncbi:Uncharacterized conserved protein, contains ParB-like and HNH nuclease domains [Rhizobiales bacterium GAS113]|nr:Uncharacterized conserved protein, contains ParB-like and HNH nuclease domains [Rhizobiales bacterium GAS113]